MIEADAETVRLAGRLSALVRAEAEQTTLRRVARTLSFMLGDRLEVGDAARYIFHYAASQGYKIPPYPMAGNGEFKQFLADEGVCDIPAWYARIGVSAEAYPHLVERTVVVVRTRAYRRKALFLDGVCHRNDSGFCGLAESGAIDRLSDEALASLLDRIFDALEADERDPTLF